MPYFLLIDYRSIHRPARNFIAFDDYHPANWAV